MSTSDLSAFELYALHWDERDQAITASFEGPLDDTSRQTWQAPPEHDWIRFHLKYPSVTDLTIEGWTYHPLTGIEEVPSGDRLSVTLTGEGTTIHFTSAPATPAGHRTSKSGSF